MDGAVQPAGSRRSEAVDANRLRRVSVPIYALEDLVTAAIVYGAEDHVAAKIAVIEMLCRQQGASLR